MRGRPTLLTPELADRLVLLLANGVSQRAAARAIAVSPRSLSRWMPQLRPRVEQARAGPATGNGLDEALLLPLLILRSGDWRASAWHLERMYPERWARPAPERDPVRWTEDGEEWP